MTSSFIDKACYYVFVNNRNAIIFDMNGNVLQLEAAQSQEEFCFIPNRIDTLMDPQCKGKAKPIKMKQMFDKNLGNIVCYVDKNGYYIDRCRLNNNFDINSLSKLSTKCDSNWIIDKKIPFEDYTREVNCVLM
jgi:hypothetical protein